MPIVARIARFRALRFDFARVADPSLPIAPPYAVIGEAPRKEWEAQHARNVGHLDLPRGEGDERTQNARRQLEAWLADGSLRQDACPAITRYEQIFSFEGASGLRSYTRKGFISRIEPEQEPPRA